MSDGAVQIGSSFVRRNRGSIVSEAGLTRPDTLIGESCDLVDEGDLHGEERIGRVFGELGGLSAHEHDRDA
jgi:hypothetical protein